MKKTYLLIVAVFSLAFAPPLLAQNGPPAQAQERREAAQAGRQGGEAYSQKAREQAQERVADIKQEVEQRRISIQQDVCERRQERLQAVLPRLSTGATKVKQSMDTVYERVQGFYDSGQLTVSNYDDMKTRVDSAKLNAEASLAVVENFQFELDCEKPGVGQQLDSYRTAVAEARDALKVYRAALVDLISSLRAAAAVEQEAAETGQDNEAEQVENDQEEETNDEQ
jgi:hypothetical protein